MSVPPTQCLQDAMLRDSCLGVPAPDNRQKHENHQISVEGSVLALQSWIGSAEFTTTHASIVLRLMDRSMRMRVFPAASPIADNWPPTWQPRPDSHREENGVT